MGRQRDNIDALEDDTARSRAIETGQAIEERGLAGAVRADEAVNDALVNGERDIRQNSQAAEPETDLVNRKEQPWLNSPVRP